MKWLIEVIKGFFTKEEKITRESFKEIKFFIKIANIIDNLRIVLFSIAKFFEKVIVILIMLCVVVGLFLVLKDLVFSPEKVLYDVITYFIESS